MGTNECGVAIGNVAVFTKEPYNKEPGLIGMDFVRLALERADTARGALDVIVDLLETHGQGGNCGCVHEEYYYNSFIIADPDEAWLLETVARFWAAERVRDVRTISNGLTIGGEWDVASPGLVEHAIEKGWCKSAADFHFARCYSDFLYTQVGSCHARQRRSTELLEANKGRITVETMMAALRDHGAGADADPSWTPSRGWLPDTLCMHTGFGPTRPGLVAGAMVAHLSPRLPTYWLTGTASTCTGIFKPVYLGGAGLPDLGPEPTATYDPDSLWWSHERLHREVIRDYAARIPAYRDERDALEATFLREAAEMHDRYRDASADERAKALAAFTASCFERASEATARWTDKVLSIPARRLPVLYSVAWNNFNKQANFVPEEKR
jgi:dipeptidase